MKKILYLITQSELGGAQKYVLDLAAALRHRCEIAVGYGEQGEQGEFAQALKNLGIRGFAIPHLKRAISPINDWRACREITELIKTLRPDIIHLNSTKISILGSLAKMLIRLSVIRGIRIYSQIRIIYTVHGWVFNEPLPAWQKTFYRLAEKFTARGKDKLICVSEFDHQIALKMKIAPAEKLLTVHNGIKAPDFRPRAAARLQLSELTGSPLISRDNVFLVGSIGNLYKNKGFEHLIGAVKLLNSGGLDCYAVIIGEGVERRALLDWTAQNGLENRVIFPGRIDNAAGLLSAFDIYACSSVKEGLSYTIIEAMLAGLPVAATNVGGNPELIADEENGLLVPPRDAPALAAAIKKLAENPGLAARLGQAAKDKAEKEFSFARMLEKTFNIYEA